MGSKGTLFIGSGVALLAAALIMMPLPLFDALSGRGVRGVALAAGTAFLLAGLGLLVTGLRRRSRNLRTPRTYATQEPTSLDEDRPVNPYALPKSYGAIPPLH